MSVGPYQPNPGNNGGAVSYDPAGAFTTDANQAQAGADLYALGQQQAAQQPAPVPDKSGHGWSLTNPFQDIGQIWHDVETHTVAPLMKADRDVYSKFISRPLSALELYSAKQFQNLAHDKESFGSLAGFNSSDWANSWNAANHISPGQGVVLSLNNAFSVVDHADGWHPAGVPDRSVDPFNQDATSAMFKNSWGNKIASGGVDAVVSTFGDPLGKLGKVSKVARIFKDAPVREVDNATRITEKLNAPRSQAFNTWALGKAASVIAEHPMVKGTAARLNPYRYQTAALIAGAKTPEEISLIRQIAAGSPSARAQLSDLGEQTAHALDSLANVSKDAASQAANLFIPAETMEKFALSSDTWANNVSWLADVSTAKTAAAQGALNEQAELVQQLLKVSGGMAGRTTSSLVAEKLAEMRGSLKYANTRSLDKVNYLQRAFYNFPVRIYQGLSDMPDGLINHRDDQAVQQARSWLNKSRVLAPDQKNDFLQQYASATPADRQRTWDTIENNVYNAVGDRYGITPDVMKKLLVTTQTRGRGLAQAARSKAFGVIDTGDGNPLSVLPTAESDVIMHPVLITQLEAGAVPLANLRHLENALKQMDRNGTLTPIVNGAHNVYDTLNYALDRVYGLWRPMSLLTGHRAYNHIGDDWLRGVAKLGALTTAQNAREGAANWMRNRGAQFTHNKFIGNVVGKHQQNIADAKAEYQGLRAQADAQNWLTPETKWVTPQALAAKKAAYDELRAIPISDLIQPKHRIGEGTFKIAGTNINWEEAFGGPNGDYWRQLTSSQHTWDSLVDDSAHKLHAVATAQRLRSWGTIRAVDDPAKHTRAYIHFIRNQMMPDPVAKQIVQGRDLDEVSNWLSNTAAGRQHMRDLHIGDPDDHVITVGQLVETHLPTDAMRDAAVAGKFGRDTIESAFPNAGQRPDINSDINMLIHGGDPTVGMLKRSMDTAMKWTGTLPDDIMVRHPVFNSMYKARLTSDVKSWMAQNGGTIDTEIANSLMTGARLGARKDMQNLLYDVSRFNDLGHTLRFVSPFFNAWFNAASTWSRLFAENPGLIARTYEAKRALWNSPFSIDKQTGQPADDKTKLDDLAFVFHAPKAMHGMLGGLTTIPIDGTKLVSPTYIDSIGSPGFGPLVAAPVNAWVKRDPTAADSPIVKSILNGIIDKNSFAAFVPSGMRDAQFLTQMLGGKPEDTVQIAKTTWSIYQEQQWDYLNGQRVNPPNWNDIKSQAEHLTAIDLIVNRLMPLGFRPAPAHAMLVNEYRNMQAQDPKNAMQNFYDKYGPAAMVFTQSLTADPVGIPATASASKLYQKYKGLIDKHPELGGVVIGPGGNGNFDDMAYQWQVANGLRKALTPQEAASKAQINLGWAAYGKARSAIQAQMMAKGIKSINEPAAKTLKAQLASYVSRFGDKNDQIYNPDFYANYASFNPNDYQNRISALLTIANDPALLANGARGDVRQLQRYSQLRDVTYAELQGRKNKTLAAASNFDIARRYDAEVADMMNKDTRFAQLYDRYLSRDDWKEPA